MELRLSSEHLAESCGSRFGQAIGLTEQLMLAVELGRLDEAQHAGHKALRLALETEDRQLTVSVLIGLALAELVRGRLWHAGLLWGNHE